MIGGILFAHQEMKPVISAIKDFADEVLPERIKHENKYADEEKQAFDAIDSKVRGDLVDAFTTTDKKERNEKVSSIKDNLMQDLDEELHDLYTKQFKEVEKDVVRGNVLVSKRIDGGMTEVRGITIKTNFLPSVHGSALLLEVRRKHCHYYIRFRKRCTDC